MRGDTLLYAFNRGLIAKQALSRIDLKRTALSAEVMTNWMPRVFGSMSLRPGLQYIGGSAGNANAIGIPFVFATDDTALLELTDSVMRVWIDDVVITRPSVSSVITNGTFTTDLTGWTDADEGAASSAFASGGYLGLTGSGTNAAIRRQEVTVSVEDQGKIHALNIVVAHGTASLSVGSAAGGTQYIDSITLRTGVHSIAFTPTGNFHIQLSSVTSYQTLVDSIVVASSGAMSLATPWGSSDLQNVRWDQSGDVLFVCDGAHRQKRIERQGAESWSVVDYSTTDGPFLGVNLSGITLTAGALVGSTTLTASKNFFKSGHVGALFRLESTGQTVTATITGDDQWTDAVRVTGEEWHRNVFFTISGISGSTVTLQMSVGAEGDWGTAESHTSDHVETRYNDGLDNQIVYYRIGVRSGGYVGGPITVTLRYPAGSSRGSAIVTSLTSATIANVDVVDNFGGTGATSTWWEGQWSDHRGWPSSVALYDGRLWWAGKDKINGSVSDSFSVFDDSTTGDSGPILRSIGSGPVDSINWLLPLNQLVVGTQGAEKGARASSLDEPLTPTAFSLKDISTQGSASVLAVKVDTNGLFVQRSRKRIYEMSVADNGYSYVSSDLTSVVPEMGDPGIVRVAAQRQPDTRIHCVRSDGTVAILVYDKIENITCWVNLETDGEVIDAVVLPTEGEEDAVYYFVRRTIGGNDLVYLERWALESEIIGGAATKLVDSGLTFAGPLTTVTGLNHLEGEMVAVWGNSKDLGTYTVASGQITLTESATGITVGLPYTAQYKSAKFAFGQCSLTDPKNIDHVGLVLANTHAQGLRYGQDFDHLDDLPLREGYTDVDPDSVWEDYDEGAIEVNGSWNADARLCLEAASPRPATVAAALVKVSGHVK